MSNEILNKERKYLLSLLSKREYTKSDLKRRLLKRNVIQTDIDFLLSEVEAAGWQSDVRYIENFIRNEVAKYRGKKRILQAIAMKGIEKEEAEVIIEKMEVNWREQLLKCYQKKYFSTLCADLSFLEKQKKIKFLISQGFMYDEINELLL